MEGVSMADADLVLSLDVGTTNVKAAVVDATGHLLKIAHREMTVERDDTGKAEHNPDALFAAVTDCLTEASEGYADRVAILVPATYQMGLIAVDADNNPVTGMMTLLDTRARSSHADLLKAISGTDLYDRTGCPPIFHFPLPKLFWVKTRRPDLYSRSTFFLSSKDYLLRRLTGCQDSDISVSSTTQYMNIKSLVWDMDILDATGISIDKLPPPASPEKIVTVGLDSLRKHLKLPNLSGVLLGAYDGGAVGIGLGGFEENCAVMNFGTTAMLRRVSGDPALSTDGSMSIASSFLAAGKWIPGGAINNAGAVLRWLRDNVFKSDYESLAMQARAAQDSDGLVFLPYLSGERSLDIGPEASGSYYGLRATHTQGHMVRAAFEGVAFSLRRVLDASVRSGFKPIIIRVGSGGSHSPIWMQIVASVLNTPLQTTHADEPGLLGSAMLGFVALGHFPDLHAATRAMVRASHTYNPDADDAKKYDSVFDEFNYLTKQMREAENHIEKAKD
jgi:gluconokinase